MLLPKPSSTTIHRKFPLFWRDLSNLLRQWLDFLQNSKDELQQHIHVYAGDVNTDNERAEPTTLQSLFDHVQAELRVQQLRLFDCTYRKGGAAHSAIDAIGVPLLRQGKFDVRWSCQVDPISIHQGHMPVSFSGALHVAHNTFGMTKHRRLHADLFLQEGPAKSALRAHMGQTACDLGFEYRQVLNMIRRQPINARLPPFEFAQNFADDTYLSMNPMQIMRMFEEHIHCWSCSRIGGRPLQRSLVDCILQAQVCEQGIKVPLQAWPKAHQILEMAIVDRSDLHGDFVHIDQQQHAVLVDALRSHYGFVSDDRMPEQDNCQIYKQLRRLLPKGAACEARLQGPHGVTSDPKEMDGIYSSARAFAQQVPDVDVDKQLEAAVLRAA